MNETAITKTNINKLLSLGYTPSRHDIVRMLNTTESEARLLRGIIVNYETIVNSLDIETDDDLIVENVKLSKQKQKYQDSNRIERKSFREYARVENAVSAYVQDLCEIFDKYEYKLSGVSHEFNGTTIGVIQLSDLHFNELIDLKSNQYDFTIASARLAKFAFEIVKYFDAHSISDVFLFFTGDMMNSDRRLDELMALSANRSKATFIAVQILEHFIADLNVHYNIHIAGVCGNESRVGKDVNWNREIVSDNYDFSIFNILRYKLKYANGIEFLGISDKNEEVVCVNGKNFLLIHGHQINSDITKSISKLIRKYIHMGVNIDYVLYGHLHEAIISDTFSRSASLCGSNSYSEDSLLLVGRASQNIYIVNDKNRIDGIKIDLQDTDGYNPYDTLNWQDAYNPKSVSKSKRTETILRITI